MKEIEKFGAKKGVNPMTIKDVNQSLVDDNLVQQDKIGIGQFFWSLPSKAGNDRQTLIKKLDDQISTTKSDIEESKSKISNA